MEKIEAIEWKEEYSIGTPYIDAKHKKFINTINMLVDVLNNEESHESFFSIYHRLAFYAENHFVEEERFFAQNNCPNLEEHRKSHINFVQSLIKFQKQYEEKREEMFPEFFQYLKNWLINHIQSYDRCAAEHLKHS
jgi:hemerythrin-like metal-binding protein